MKNNKNNETRKKNKPSLFANIDSEVSGMFNGLSSGGRRNAANFQGNGKHYNSASPVAGYYKH